MTKLTAALSNFAEASKARARAHTHTHTHTHIHIFSVALQPNAGQDLLILEASGSHTTTHHIR